MSEPLETTAARRRQQQRTGKGGGVMDEAYLQVEFDKFFEFDTADRSTVSSVSARLFADALAQPWEHEVERLRAELADALDVKRGDGPTALAMVIADRDVLRDELADTQAYAERLREVFEHIEKNASSPGDCWFLHHSHQALALPRNHAALTERLAQERAGERERCAKATESHIAEFCTSSSDFTRGYVAALRDASEGIRALGDAQ